MMWAPYKKSERMWRRVGPNVALCRLFLLAFALGQEREAERGWEEAEAGGKTNRGDGDISPFSLDRRHGYGET